MRERSTTVMPESGPGADMELPRGAVALRVLGAIPSAGFRPGAIEVEGPSLAPAMGSGDGRRLSRERTLFYGGYAVMAMSIRTLLVVTPHGFYRMSYAEWAGPAGVPTVLCVHGLTRNGRDFDTLAEALS